MVVKAEICNMQILVIAATEAEIQPFIDADTAIDVLITGVGVPSTMYHLQKRLQQLEYDLVIQAGIAGSFEADITPGQTVLVEADCFGDIGMEEREIFTPIFKTELAGEDEFPYEKGWLINKNIFLQDSDLPKVRSITVNKISDASLQKQQFVQVFHASIESMEGAALHYVCLQENVPFIQLRAISNDIGERNKTNWKLDEAIENLNKALLQIVRRSVL